MKLYKLAIAGLAVGFAAGFFCKEGYNMVLAAEKKETPILTVPTGAFGTRAVAAADMNNDGLTDLLSAEVNGDVFIYQNQGNKYVKSEKPILRIPTGFCGVRGFGAADMNGDGLVDIISTNSLGEVKIHKNLGDNKFK